MPREGHCSGGNGGHPTRIPLRQELKQDPLQSSCTPHQTTRTHQARHEQMLRMLRHEQSLHKTSRSTTQASRCWAIHAGIWMGPKFTWRTHVGARRLAVDHRSNHFHNLEQSHTTSWQQLHWTTRRAAALLSASPMHRFSAVLQAPTCVRAHAADALPSEIMNPNRRNTTSSPSSQVCCRTSSA